MIKVISDKTTSELYYYACLNELNLLDRADVKNILLLIDQVTNKGIYYDLFLGLIYNSDEKPMEEIKLIFKQVLNAINIPAPAGRKEAVNTVIWYHLNKVLHQHASPSEEIGTLYYFFILDHDWDTFPPPLSELFQTYYFEVDSLSEHESDHKKLDEWDKIDQRLLSIATLCFQFLQTDQNT